MKITANGTQLNVIEQGNGTTFIVLLHYFGGSAREWDVVVDRITTQFPVHCLAVDLRGHGQSDAPDTGYSVDDMADDLADLIDHFGLTGAPDRDFVLVGHSMGGKVALALATRRPTGLRSLVLLAPSPPSPEPIPDDTRERLLATQGQRDMAERTLHEITMISLPEPVQQQIIDDNVHTSAAAWRAWLQHGSREDITDRMPQIEIPVYVAAGEKDTNIPVELLKTVLLPLLPTDTTLTMVPGAGHLLPYETPDAVLTMLATALGR